MWGSTIHRLGTLHAIWAATNRVRLLSPLRHQTHWQKNWLTILGYRFSIEMVISSGPGGVSFHSERDCCSSPKGEWGIEILTILMSLTSVKGCTFKFCRRHVMLHLVAVGSEAACIRKVLSKVLCHLCRINYCKVIYFQRWGWWRITFSFNFFLICSLCVKYFHSRCTLLYCSCTALVT